MPKVRHGQFLYHQCPMSKLSKFRILPYSERPKSAISNQIKNGYIWATQWPSSSELKIKFDPSLDKFFKIIKKHGPKNPPRGVIWVWSLVRKRNDNLAVQCEDCPWLGNLGKKTINVEFKYCVAQIGFMAYEVFYRRIVWLY